VVITEISTQQQEVPDAIGWCPAPVVVEAKVSRSDFLKDAKKPWRETPDIGLGVLRYYLSPPGIIEKSDLPPNWGLLWASEWPNVELMVRAKPQAGNDGLVLLLSAMRRLRWTPNNNIRVKTYQDIPITKQIPRTVMSVRAMPEEERDE
jgi:hypothetical protein